MTQENLSRHREGELKLSRDFARECVGGWGLYAMSQPWLKEETEQRLQQGSPCLITLDLVPCH